MTTENKLPLTSSDVTAEVLAQLREIAPQVFTEGGVDFDKLKATLGENVVPKDERYGLSWAGKSEAFRNVQIPSVGTLLPQPEESINFDTSENIIIEGDNLEALKLLQKSYHGKVKMIYIDPPYNTGNEFIYPDNFREGLDDYLKYSGQVNDERQRNSSETDTTGRFHSKWLNMMYPRLFLARNLLREDGVIFVSIDDNEVHNLRLLLNEVFGEENFEGHIHWRRRHNQPNDPTKMIGLVAEHILSFSKNKEAFKQSGVGKIELTGDFSNPDKDSRGDWASKAWKVGSDQSGSKYSITSPSGKVLDGEWMGEEKTFKALLADNRIVWPRGGDGFPRKKYFRYEREEEGQCATNWWTHESFGHNQAANDDMTELFGVKNVFSNPKPKELIKGLLKISNCKNNDVCLDFFAGSGTTAHAVLALNSEDNKNRKFVLVQLPEKIENLDFPTIASITRERVRRVIEKLNSEAPKTEQDRGFKAFKLTSSNFKIWNADTTSTDAETIGKQLRLYADNVERERSQQDILYELVLKSGLPLAAKIEDIEVAGKPVYSIAQGQLLICLESEISQAVLRGMIALTPIQMVCLDRAFGGNDQMKTNTVLEAKSQDVTFRTV